MNEQKYIQIFRWITLVSGIVLAFLLLSAWISNTWFPSWKKYQAEYYRIVKEQGADNSIKPNSPGIRQVSSRELRRTDRCITCHLGLENPDMAGVPQPHAQHPGDFLSDHPYEQFGCTVCHGGQGRAVSRIQAFGLDPSTHWDFPLLYPPYIESSCGKCHLAIFSLQTLLHGTGTFLHGKEIFNREGCLGCHKARGVGGIVGPDLTEQGDKTKHEYSFENIRGEQTISNWLKEHFRDPEMVSPGSDMLKMDLPEEELEALVTFTMGLAKPDIAYDFLGVDALKEFKGIRESLSPVLSYSMICSACHGKQGKGKDYGTYKTGVPSIWNHDFLRVASAEMIEFTLLKGRGARQMASWLPLHSGLESGEIKSLVRMIEEKQTGNPEFSAVSSISGDTQDGRAIYIRDCRQCHGEDGSGDIGLPLNNLDFLSIASDKFLYQTIFLGRNVSGMPSWAHYSKQDMADLISYLRTWGSGPVGDPVIQLLPGDTLQGDLKYHYLCSRCHGEFGEGNTGPAIMSPDFLSHASNAYLFHTISEGRSHTAMFGWTTDVQGAGKLDRQGVSDIIFYMRQVAEGERDYIYQGSNPGNAAPGKGVFAEHCAQCHGLNGEGTDAPALNNQEFLSAATNGYIMATITIGREGTKMPSWGRGSDDFPALNPGERKDPVAYIRSWQRIRIRK